MSKPAMAQQVDLVGDGPVPMTFSYYTCDTGFNNCSLDNTDSITGYANLNAMMDLSTVWNGPVAGSGNLSFSSSDGIANFFVRYTGADANGYAEFEAYDIAAEAYDSECYISACGRLVIDVTGGQFPVTAYPSILAPTPEPASWAMMLIGFGAIGLALRGRRAAVPQAS